MELPSGQKVVRSLLQQDASRLIALGARAVPFLLPWVSHENTALSYVAIYALQEITGLRPSISYFDTQDKEGNRKMAVAAWQKWYETQRSGDTHL
jgi:hypothetical protein